MSLRLRLALLYTLVLSITLALGGVVLLVLLRRALVAEVDRSLVALAQEFNTTRYVQDVQPRTRVLTPNSGTPQTYVEVFNRNGIVTASSPNLAQQLLPLDAALIASAADSTPHYVTVSHRGTLVRVYIAPLHVGDRMRGTVALGRSLDMVSGTMVTVTRVLLRSDLVLIVLAFLSGMGLARATLQPIDRMTRTAATIGEGLDLSRRVDYHGPPDEIGRLAATMNQMIDHMETAYRGQQDALERQQRFVADASHDLRTPLTSVLGNLQFLARARPLPPDELAAVLGDIGSSMERMGRLLDNLLALARADAGQLKRERVDISRMLRAVAREAQPLKPDVVILVDSIAELYVCADAGQLHRAILALADNGLKYTPSGGSIRLTAEGNNDRVQLCVTDTGIGIAPEHLEHIFERFYRIDPARSGGGTGLGLSVAQATVAAMGGTITVTSTLGRGSRFTIDLPAVAQTASLPASSGLEPAGHI